MRRNEGILYAQKWLVLLISILNLTNNKWVK